MQITVLKLALAKKSVSKEEVAPQLTILLAKSYLACSQRGEG
jgi:hypothetical protein